MSYGNRRYSDTGVYQEHNPHTTLKRTVKGHLKSWRWCPSCWTSSRRSQEPGYPAPQTLSSTTPRLPVMASVSPAHQQTCEFYAVLPPFPPAPCCGLGQTGSHQDQYCHTLLGHSPHAQPAGCRTPIGRESQRSRAGGQRRCPASAEGTGSICERQGEKHQSPLQVSGPLLTNTQYWSHL